MFYFQNLFNTALSGIDAGGATGGVVQIAQYILLAALMFGIFQAWAQGGDTQQLGVTGEAEFLRERFANVLSTSIEKRARKIDQEQD